MTDRKSDERSPVRTLGASKDRPRFLQIFDELRRRPSRSRDRALRRMASRATRRHVPERGALQRGDLAEPPPVLDLVLDRDSDRARVQSMLVESCAVGPVWTLPLGGPTADTEVEEKDEEGAENPSRSRPAKRASLRRSRLLSRWSRPAPDEVVRPALAPPPGEREGPEADVTTDQLYELIGSLVDGGFAWTRSEEGRKELVPPRRRRFPPSPRLPRLHSLLWLHRCGLGSNEDDGGRGVPDRRLENDSRSQIEVIGRLRETRLEAAVEQRDRALEEASSSTDDGRGRRWTLLYKRALVHWRRAAWSATAVSRWVTRVSEKATFGLLDEKLLTPLSFLVSLIVAATPFAFLGLAAQRLNEVAQRFNDLVSLASGFLLAAVYLLTVFFFFLPWRPYLWLGDYRSTLDEGARKSSDGTGTGRLGRSRVLGLHLFNELHHPDRDTGRLGAGRGEKGTLPPPAHRIAVSALLDDLHRLYGASSLWRGGARDARPVLIYDQRELGPVGRYLVRLIEDERLRRALPDPLLLVQIRDGERPALVSESIESARYGHLPEYDGSAKTSREVRAWLRDRHLAGTLGVSRVLTTKVAPLAREARERRWHTPPAWVPTRSAWATRALGGCAVVVALVLFSQEVVNPLQTKMGFCVGEGVTKPRGIFRVDRSSGGPGAKECVGVTYGEVRFHGRLDGVIELIREQNEEVDKSGESYVTIAHMADMSASTKEGKEGKEDYALAGVQGELFGMALAQREHNEDPGDRPMIKLLLGNAGEGWAHAETTAEEIVRRARNERSGMDRPIAAVGFGQSLVPNGTAIQKISEAFIPIVGTTATYDDVALSEPWGHSGFYFPIAPSNSRIAEQAAYWARHGASWKDGDSEEGLPAHATAVAIAHNPPPPGGEKEHEQYGPHLAERFMDFFEGFDGEPWRGSEGLGESEQAGVLLYQEEREGDGPTLREVVKKVCAPKEPPELLYYAGRAQDFKAFYEEFRKSAWEACHRGEMTILGGDDVSKFISDEEVLIEGNSERHRVFYTPLAPSDSWGVQAEEGSGADDESVENGDENAGTDDEEFYDEVRGLVAESQGVKKEPEEGEEETTEEDPKASAKEEGATRRRPLTHTPSWATTP
ncbi:hypothetical protein [Nocardiopsis alba]|uniref:hypothetical protein n=1 Tax=Nocardiopsis alba TaxID=53437 RepID=UPI00034C5D3A|nr:hypothetical protein [Nocardiopsis alba]